MTPSLLLLTSLALAAPGRMDLAASARVEGRVRDTAGASATAEPEGEALLTPRAEGRYEQGALALSAAYTPTLTLRDALGDPGTDVLHTGQLRLELTSGERLQTFSQVTASYGRVRFGLLEAAAAEVPGGGDGGGDTETPGTPDAPETPGAPAPPTTPTAPGGGAPAPPTSARVPTRVLDTEAFEGRAGFTYLVTRRTTFGAAAGFTRSGGRGDAAREVVPLQQGPLLESRLGYALTRRDALGLELDARDAHFTGGPADGASRIALAALRGRWERRLAEETALTLGSGVSLGYSSLRARAVDVVTLSALASAGLTHAFRVRGDTVTATGAASLTSNADPYSATLQRYGTLGGRVAWLPDTERELGFELGATTNMFVPAGARQRLLLGTLRARQSLGARASLDAFAGYALEGGPPRVALRHQWQLGVGFSVVADELR